jgi:alpha-mannosidase
MESSSIRGGRVNKMQVPRPAFGWAEGTSSLEDAFEQSAPSRETVARGGTGLGFRSWLILVVGGLVLSTVAAPVASQEPEEANARLDQEKVLYVTATAHLDTQWLWTIQTTIDEYIPATLRDNFALFEKYPHYVFSFEGAWRYMLAKEYYPADYARLKEYIRTGQWHVCGSSVDAGDVNVPSPESLIRQVLYGNGFFKQEFGKTSCDIYLPDCFGFSYALPSVAAHCGLKGFSTQKLAWGSSVGIPFGTIEWKNEDGETSEVPIGIGVWEGVDGSCVIASLNPGAYDSSLDEDLSQNGQWLARIDELGAESGAYVAHKYFGTGDVGGAPSDDSVAWLEKSVRGTGPICVRSAPADQLYRDLRPEQVAKLPRYKGELLMQRHGVGCYTSQAAMKRWNRMNEQLADAAERAAVAADWLRGASYPRQKLSEAWIRFLWHQFHDDLTGTSVPEAYTFSWNDEILSLNQFAEVLRNSAGAVCRALDTHAEGEPIVVYNPLSIEREDVVEATVRFSGNAPQAVRVFGPNGEETPSQMAGVGEGVVHVAFLARVPSVGFAVFDVRRADAPCDLDTGLRVETSKLENPYYAVRLDENGDIASLYDKVAERDIFASPARLQLLTDSPRHWPEWEVDYDDLTAPPRTCVAGPARIRIIERGPARVTLEVCREVERSTFVQRIRLAAGRAGDRVDVDCRVDWRTPRTLLKAAFPLTVSSPVATYDLGLGAVQRGNNTEKLYEVPAQQWADLTAPDGSYGVAILNDCKYGWDKPSDNTLRLTLIHSPDCIEKDMGYHRFAYAMTGHRGAWQDSDVAWRAARLNQALRAFQPPRHDGSLGRSVSMIRTNNPQTAIRAVKKAERGDEIIVRVQELHGHPAKEVRLSAIAPIVAAREVNGVEDPVDGEFTVAEGALVFDLLAYRPRTFALTLAPPSVALNSPESQPVALDFDADVISLNEDMDDGDFDGQGRTLPGELLPPRLVMDDISFELGPSAKGEQNAVTCRGQSIPLPDGGFDRVYLLAAALDNEARGVFRVGGAEVELSVPGFTGFIGQSQSLVSIQEEQMTGPPWPVPAAGRSPRPWSFLPDRRRLPLERMTPPFIQRQPVAWAASHHHTAAGRDEPYMFCYLHKLSLKAPLPASSLTLPDNHGIRILAVTVAKNPNEVVAASDPYDDPIAVQILPAREIAVEPISVILSVSSPRTEIRYTLDGSEPTADSELYCGPIPVSRSTTVKARAFVDGKPNAYVACRRYTFVQPLEPIPMDALASGLGYRCFEPAPGEVVDFRTAKPVRSGTTDRLRVDGLKLDSRLAVEYAGYVNIPTDGVFQFATVSDCGCRLYINEELVVDNVSWRFRAMKRFGSIALKAGLHPITVQYYNGIRTDVLRAYMAGPGVPWQEISGSMLFRTACHAVESDENSDAPGGPLTPGSAPASSPTAT